MSAQQLHDSKERHISRKAGLGRQVSVVIPAFNERESLTELFQRLENVAASNQYELELILVDDGSTDGTDEFIESYDSQHIKSIACVILRSNMGKSAALSEGVTRANSDVVVTMDADLQDQPEAIPSLLALIDQGYDVVSGWKRQRRDPWLGKKLPSLVFNSLVRWIFGSSLRDVNCGLKAYRKEVWDDIRIYGELHRFIPILAANKGYKVAEVEVEHQPRKHGVSKYGASRFAKGLFDVLTVFFLNTYSRRPLHFFGWLGLSFFLLGFVAALYLTVLWFSGIPIGKRPLLLFSVLLMLIGVQIILFGLLSQLQIDLFYRDHVERSHGRVILKTLHASRKRGIKKGSPTRS